MIYIPKVVKPKTISCCKQVLTQLTYICYIYKIVISLNIIKTTTSNLPLY